MGKKLTTVVVEISAILVGLFVWVGLAIYADWYLMGGIIGFIFGIIFVILFNWLGSISGYWRAVDIDDFKIYGWIPWWL